MATGYVTRPSRNQEYYSGDYSFLNPVRTYIKSIMPDLLNQGRFLSLCTPSEERALEDCMDAGREAERSYGFSPKTYPYIALSHEQFVEAVCKYIKPGATVIDVGCGGGDKLIALHRMCPSLHITGLEHNPLTAKVAHYMAPFANVIEGDAFKNDFGVYDLIYMYRPIPDPTLMSELQHHVISSMRPGAVLVVVFQEPHDCRSDRKLPMYFPNLKKGWKKECGPYVRSDYSH